MDLDTRLATSRTSYERSVLRESDAASDPIAQMRAWTDEASGRDDVPEPNAMTVATVDADGRPSARIVLLRGLDDRGVVFFTNYESRKGRALAAHARAAVVLWWQPLEKQIRLEGTVAKLTDAESDTYFAQRPRGHRISAWASHQSAVIPDRASVERAMHETEERFPDDVPRPPFWGGYRITPEAIEFWQGRRNRVHDRLLYVRDGERWTIERLAP